MILASIKYLGAPPGSEPTFSPETIIPAAATIPIIEFSTPTNPNDHIAAALEADRWTKNRFWLTVGGIAASMALAIGTGFYVRQHLRRKQRDPSPPSYDEKALSVILPNP